MKHLAIGLMSGTSADGVSLVLAEFQDLSCRVLDFHTFSYQRDITEKIYRAARLSVSELSSLNFTLGAIFSRRVLNLLKKNRFSSSKIKVIGSHGQTVFHGPRGNPPSTLQIGEPAVIAENTGITVVSDFRPRDIAAGGEGAPLIPFFDHFFFGKGADRAFQNIGGIANVTVVGKGVAHPIAFDTGPGNCLMDWAARKISQGSLQYDQDGKMAAQGKVWMDIVRQMSAHSYFKRRPPKSTGRELFSENFIPSSLKSRLKKYPYDAISTLTYFTAFMIAQSYRRFIFRDHRLNEIVVSGGGALNKTLMRHLKKLFSPLQVISIEKFGIHPQAKEPLAFAFFALRTLQGKINHLPEGTGARSGAILGKITPGKSFRGIR